MYNGYTETDEHARNRLNARHLRHIAIMYGKDWEQDADAVRKLIASAELRDGHPVDEAQAMERGIDAELYDFTPFPANMPDIDFDGIDEIPF